MTAAPNPALEAFMAAVLELVGHHSWSRERLAEHRRIELRAAVAHAVARSRWHRERLGGVALDEVEPDRLDGLPTMTKADLMAHWDDIVTDPRLTLDLALAHLRHVDEHGFAPLLDRYDVFTTGGSTGEPGVFCWSLDEVARWGASATRWSVAAGLGPPQVMAWVGARSPRHPTGAGPMLLGGTPDLSVPVDQPVDAIVRRLNELRPDALMAVCSILPALVEAAERGDLRIEVDRISVFGDMLDRDAVRRATAMFGVVPLEGYPTTDVGHIAGQAAGEDGLYVNDDLLIVEPVDATEQPVPDGEPCDHLLVTSLHQRTLPLIRYRIDDRVIFDATSGSQAPFRRIAAIDGRSDDVLRYPGAAVHPHVFRSALSRHPAIRDYQVVQRVDGAEVIAEVRGHLDTGAVTGELVDALARAGLPGARVVVTVTDDLARTPVGKRRRFVPLADAGA